MTKKIISFSLFIGLMTCVAFSMESDQDKEQVRRKEPQPSVFDKGKSTKIMGNTLWDVIHVNYQKNPSPQFGDTLFVHCTKNLEYTEEFTVNDLKKAYERKHPNKEKIWERENLYAKHAAANNAIVCPDLLQKTNRDGELKNIAVVIFGTQNTAHCDRFKDFLDARQKAESDKDSNPEWY